MNRYLSADELHLSCSSYGKSNLKDSDFKKNKRRVESETKQLKRHGHGNRPKATTALTDDEIAMLFDKMLLGLSSPQALLNTVWPNNMIFLAFADVGNRKNSAGRLRFKNWQ